MISCAPFFLNLLPKNVLPQVAPLPTMHHASKLVIDWFCTPVNQKNRQVDTHEIWFSSQL